ncbi:MAG: HAMP domain-containing histidine kinase [Bifidobacteriaceae bacterium]|jgi:signal transduction histidine kinase|nr:HAMP domain-containing histidine kinase [Bifidobacteriaceae bacterium]
MTARRLAVALTAAVAALTALAWALIKPPQPPTPDLPALNDVAAQLTREISRVGTAGYELPNPPGTPPYAVVGPDGRLLDATGPDAPGTVAAAINRRGTVLNLLDGDRLAGQVLFATADDAALAAQAKALRWTFVALAAALEIAALALLWRAHRTMLRPFREMRAFARQVAAGDLDAPLRMDKANAFGAFTEAFDLMRGELSDARERERAQDRARKELVASLGHDMKTPVASIKAVAELMAAQTSDEQAAKRLAVIGAKADQIDALASNLLDGALQDLEVLPVNPREIGSREVAEMLTEADHLGWLDGAALPDCLVKADPLRLAQTLGNIVANSYKYGAPPIRPAARIEAGWLVLTLADGGPGADPEELSLLTRKFYRGRAGAGKTGAGLGLYLADHLMTRMGGHLTCENAEGSGFAVTLRLALA